MTGKVTSMRETLSDEYYVRGPRRVVSPPMKTAKLAKAWYLERHPRTNWEKLFEKGYRLVRVVSTRDAVAH